MLIRVVQVAIPICCLALASSAAAQKVDGAAVANRLAGCWAVSLGPYLPAMAIGADTVFTQPPQRIEIDSIHGTGPVPGGRWALHPAQNTRGSVHRLATLTILSADSNILSWSTGFSGLGIRAAVGQDTLRGVAHTDWDFGRPSQRADALLVRESVGCRCAAN